MRAVDKPIRLYVLTILIVVAYGLLPFVSVFFVDKRTAFLVGFRNLPLNGSISMLDGSNGDMNFLLVLISLFLCVFTTAAAVWSFTGDSLGRVAVLAFITADVLWWSGIVLYWILYSQDNAAVKLNWGMQLIPPPIWLGVIWWNFTRPDLNVYYEFNSKASE